MIFSEIRKFYAIFCEKQFGRYGVGLKKEDIEYSQKST